MRLEQGHTGACMGEQGGSSETGDATADHDHVLVAHGGMLAVQRVGPWMQPELERLEGRCGVAGRGQLDQCHALGGGCSQQAWRLQLSDGRCLFAKQGDAAMLEAEQMGLAALHSAADPADLVVPEPLALLVDSAGSALVLPWLEQQSGDQQALAVVWPVAPPLACAGLWTFWLGDGWIHWTGSPACRLARSLGKAFVELRLRPQLQLARPGAVAGPAGVLAYPAHRAFGSARAEPVLVHGTSGEAMPVCSAMAAASD